MAITAYKKKNGKTAYEVKEYLGKENGRSKYFRKKGFETKAKARAAILQAHEEFENPEKKQKNILNDTRVRVFACHNHTDTTI